MARNQAQPWGTAGEGEGTGRGVHLLLEGEPDYYIPPPARPGFPSGNFNYFSLLFKGKSFLKSFCVAIFYGFGGVFFRNPAG